MSPETFRSGSMPASRSSSSVGTSSTPCNPSRASSKFSRASQLPSGHVNFYALAEVLTPIERRAGGGPALETLEFLTESRGFELVHTAREDVTRGLAIYRREDDIEMVDCFTVAYMRREGLEYIHSFDGDFDSIENVTRLDTPDDPFA